MALEHFDVDGVATTVDFHTELVRRPEFTRAEIHTRWVEEQMLALVH
jgi:acetyl-CoA carboxylase biotin carboxylase subunit